MRDLDIARVFHEANRALQLVQQAPGIPVAGPWDDLTTADQAVVVDGVAHARRRLSPAEMHATWCEAKRAQGWKWGPVKDPHALLHPCLVDYEHLPADQQAKDELLSAIVHAPTPADGSEDPRG